MQSCIIERGEKGTKEGGRQRQRHRRRRRRRRRGRGTDADADAEEEAEVVSVCPLALHTLRFEFLSRVGIFSPPSLPRDVL